MQTFFFALILIIATASNTESSTSVSSERCAENPSEHVNGGCGRNLNRNNLDTTARNTENMMDKQELKDDSISNEAVNSESETLEGGSKGCCHGLDREQFGTSKKNTLAYDNTALGEDIETAALVHLEGGTFTMGSNPNDGFVFGDDGEGPPRRVKVSPFAIGKFEVSNERFSEFVRRTNYVTESEKFGWSFAVEPFIPEDIKANITSAVAAAPWWLPVNNSDWRRPNGPHTSIEGIMDHPVTQVSWTDAKAFCKWSMPGGDLPYEAQWEFAARGGLERKRLPWGDELLPDGKHRMNVWQTKIPSDQLGDRNLYMYGEKSLSLIHYYYNAENSGEDGYLETAPVDAYGPQNAYGIYNIVGNVWEWTNDWFKVKHKLGRKKRSKGMKAKKSDDSLEERRVIKNPKGPRKSPMGSKVKKGGSYLCNYLTCYRYRTSARMMLSPDSAASNVGFRCTAPYDPEQAKLQKNKKDLNENLKHDEL